MDVSPTTPVLVGVAAVQNRPATPDEGQEPLQMMLQALRRAEADTGVEGVLASADRIEVPKGIWSYTNPASLLAAELGCDSAQTVLAEIGILQQTLINRACDSIAAGDVDVVLVTGAEAKFRALLAQKAGVEVSETPQPDAVADVVLQPDAELWSSVESDAGLGMPVGYYAILDSALRYAQGLSVEQHRDQMAQIYAAFSEVAADNPDAWAGHSESAEFIRNASERNRMLAFPYTKLHNSQWNVDQAAGLIFCSARRATELGIDRSRWVFPLAATEHNAMSVASARVDLGRSPGFAVTGSRVLELARRSLDEVGLMELYSCFPFAVRVQLHELGIAAERALTVTGAMTFGGGPLNNFVLQATVRMAQLLRSDPAESGLVTSVSGMNTKQACALYSATPNPGGWQYEDVTAEVRAAMPLCEVVGDYCGAGIIAGYTVLYQGSDPWRAVAVCDIEGQQRSVAFNEDPQVLEAMQLEEFCGRAVSLAEGRFSLV